MSESLEDIEQEIDSIDEMQTSVIDVSFINNSNSQKSKLINNSDSTFTYKLHNKSYDFDLKEPMFIEKIHLKSLKNDLENMGLVVHDYFTDEKISIPIANYKEHKYIAVKINRVISRFTITPPKKSEKIELQSLELFGFSFSELSLIVEIFKKSNTTKKELKSLYEENLADIKLKQEELLLNEKKATEISTSLDKDILIKKASITELNTELVELKSFVKTESSSSEILKKSIAALQLNENQLNTNLMNLTNNIQQREEESSILNKNIAIEKNELQKLTEDKNLFAYELREFLEEGSKNTRTYFWIALIPMLLIVLLTWTLFQGTVDLTTIYVEQKDMSISTIFWSRLPFVLVIASIVFVCYEVTKIFFQKVMDIHNQKLNFSKIGIIAKDVANTSFDGLILNENEKFELRTKLKMQLLREYLSKEFDIVHDYNINKSLWSRFTEWIKVNDNLIPVKNIVEEIIPDTKK